jgi:hypothetical protein
MSIINIKRDTLRNAATYLLEACLAARRALNQRPNEFSEELKVLNRAIKIAGKE